MKTLVIGSQGQLGQAMVRLAPSWAACKYLDLPELDITDVDALLTICRQWNPDVVVNAAAYTAVDKAESEIAQARAVNVDGPKNAAVAANAVGARLIHISTDFVFDGEGEVPYKPEETPNPNSVYGQTKYDGEIAVRETHPNSALVLRTAWLYSVNGSNFVRTMLRLMNEREEISVVSDQFGSPTWADSLANTVWAIANASRLNGIYHWTDGGKASWYEFAVEIQEQALSLGLLKKKIAIRAVSTEQYPTAATRPHYSVLDCSATCSALNIQQTPWRDNLRRMLEGVTS